jgi:hypothetical protein
MAAKAVGGMKDVRVPYGPRRSELEAEAVKRGVKGAGSMTLGQLKDALGVKPEPFVYSGKEKLS